MLSESTTPAEYVQWIIENESEDDFRTAIASNENASTEQLAWAAEHHGQRARKLVLDHPHASLDTIRKIHDEAVQELPQAEQDAQGVSPEQDYNRWVLKTQTELMMHAASVLLTRGAE
jgi:hypothetical protein